MTAPVYDDPAPYEPPPPRPALEGADVAPAPLDTPYPALADAVVHHMNLNELMTGWWKEVKDITIHPDGAGNHFMAYAAARGWQIVEAPAPKHSIGTSR